MKLIAFFCSVFFALLVASFVWFQVGSSSNLDFLKESCPATFKAAGWDVGGYAGYEWGFGGFGSPYGGAKVWFYMRSPTTKLTYQGYCMRWGNETHLYGPMPAEKNVISN